MQAIFFAAGRDSAPGGRAISRSPTAIKAQVRKNRYLFTAPTLQV